MSGVSSSSWTGSSFALLELLLVSLSRAILLYLCQEKTSTLTATLNTEIARALVEISAYLSSKIYPPYPANENCYKQWRI